MGVVAQRVGEGFLVAAEEVARELVLGERIAEQVGVDEANPELRDHAVRVVADVEELRAHQGARRLNHRPERGVEGLVHVTTLKDDYYSLMEKEHALIGENTKRRFRIGGEVSVAIKNVDIERRRIDLELSENFPGAKAKKGRRK